MTQSSGKVIMKYFVLLLLSASFLFAAFDVQTTWIHSSLVEATGTETTPDNVDQTVIGNAATTYSETYEKNVTRDDSGILNSANLSYQVNSTQSPQGMADGYTFTSDASSFGTLLNQTGARTEFHYSTSTAFSASESFTLTTTLVSYGQLNDFSLWVDGALWWSAISGFAPTPAPDVNEDPFRVYGLGSDFEVQILGFGENPSTVGGLRSIELAGLLDDLEPAHDFEVRFDWSQIATESGNTGVSFFEYDLDLATVPEASTLIPPSLSIFYLFFMRLFSRRATR